MTSTLGTNKFIDFYFKVLRMVEFSNSGNRNLFKIYMRLFFNKSGKYKEKVRERKKERKKEKNKNKNGR